MNPEFTLSQRYANAVRGLLCSLVLDISKLGRTLASTVPTAAYEGPGFTRRAQWIGAFVSVETAGE